VLLAVWTGPLLCGWLLSMLFATDRDFIVYSFSPLLRALLFNGIGLVSLAAIALGVSSLGRQSRTTVSIWIGLWIVLGAIASPPVTSNWIRRASFTHDLSEVRQAVFRVDSAFADAAEKLPLIDPKIVQNLKLAGKNAEATDTTGSLAGLGVLIVISSFVFLPQTPPRMSTIVQAESLSRFYGMILGLNNVSFQIRPGITGVVGPNGAGKTTLVPSHARPDPAQLGPADRPRRAALEQPAVQARIAYCPESETLPAGLRPLEWLTASA
jgi:ABC-type multidrug transport system fused ATPase/permease subunit